MFGSRTTRIRRARLVPIALTTAALSSAVLGASVTGTLSAFNASITNSSNTATSGSLVMKEVGPDSTTTCLSSSGANNSYASCGTINKYGGDGSALTPGTKHDTVVTFMNTGSVSASSFKLAADACTRTWLGGGTGTTANGGNLCDSLQLTLTCAPVSGNTVGSSTDVYRDQSLNTVAGQTTTLPSSCVPQASSGNSVQFSFSVKMPSGQDNTVQGQQVSQPLTWTFTGA